MIGLGRFVIVIGVDSLILPMGVVFGLVGDRKGYLFPSFEQESLDADSGLL